MKLFTFLEELIFENYLIFSLFKKIILNFCEVLLIPHFSSWDLFSPDANMLACVVYDSLAVEFVFLTSHCKVSVSDDEACSFKKCF